MDARVTQNAAAGLGRFVVQQYDYFYFGTTPLRSGHSTNHGVYRVVA